jgi:hypothetical protein
MGMQSETSQGGQEMYRKSGPRSNLAHLRTSLHLVRGGSITEQAGKQCVILQAA